MKRRSRRVRVDPSISGCAWTLLVVCLCVIVWELPFFRATGEVCGCGRIAIDLPRAEHGLDLELAPTLVVPRSGVPTLDGRRADETTIAGELAAQRRNWSVLHPCERFPGTLMIQADRRTEWGALRPLLAIAAREGYPRPQLVVDAEPIDGSDFDWSRFR
ncbi:ExbD/TolR family protein [Sandaracinus amylolyticus]|uniref:ExbD/TolR family protein n=1 Tax=Sandaracinus amylolyticus TaxID=927083 RepID=UPI001F1CCBF6|nr:hypothetical protein [Sandaracinus amylolyticus]UJR84444.1 Hypothetical protein I5071_65230 [Sandaracinus amylolyticus]